MPPKRAPGGGRKPQGEIKGKRATFATRITPETRAALERSAARHGRSLSQEIEILLKQALGMPEIEGLRGWGGRHHYALGRLLAYTAGRVEAVLGFYLPGKPWFADTFAAQALQIAIGIVLKEISPKGPLKIPEEVKKLADWTEQLLPPGTKPDYGTPESLGAMVGLQVVLDIKTHTTSGPARDITEDEAVINANVAEFMPAVRQNLGLNSTEENQP